MKCILMRCCTWFDNSPIPSAEPTFKMLDRILWGSFSGSLKPQKLTPRSAVRCFRRSLGWFPARRAVWVSG